MGTESLPNEEIEAKQYNHYKNKFEVVTTPDQFRKYAKHKLKKVWYNDRGRKCLESFLYLFDVGDNKYKYVDIVGGKTQPERKEAVIDELFTPEVLIFAGFMTDAEIQDVIKTRMQGLDY